MSEEPAVADGVAGLRVGILGATGLIGSALRKRLGAAGAEVVGFSRRVEGRSGEWRSSVGELDLGGLDAVVNLAGESVAQRWSDEVRERIRESRIGLSRRIVEALRTLPEDGRPRVFLSGSAVGYYGDRGEEELREDAALGDGFLAEVCRDWEAEAARAGDLGVRVCFLRTGVVLGEDSEAWVRLSKVFRWGLGGKLGDGKQWMPWVHLEDEVRAIEFLLHQSDLQGPVNLVAPGVVRNAEFTRQVAAALHRPAVFTVPGWALRAGLGGFAEQLLGSQRVVPAALEEAGFQFAHPDLEAALAALCG